jgi:hypothetical protein
VHRAVDDHEDMKWRPWLVALLGAMPLFILFAGLAAAADEFDSRAPWAILGMVLFAASIAAWKAAHADRH